MIKLLATDLDGTLIPLDDDPQQKRDLRLLEDELRGRSVDLIFVTGRHADSAVGAIREHELPQPQAVICNVGTTIMRDDGDGGFRSDDEYSAALRTLTEGVASDEIHALLTHLQPLEKQEAFKQAEFKLSYYTDSNRLEGIAGQIRERLREQSVRWDVIASVDPFNGDGLIDILPNSVSKSYAIAWWTQRRGLSSGDLLFAGDSGNDIAAMTAGWKATIVGNAADDVVTAARQLASDRGVSDLLFHSRHSASSGVLDGLRYWLGQQ